MNPGEQPFLDTTFTMTHQEIWRASVAGSLRRVWWLLLIGLVATTMLIVNFGPSGEYLAFDILYWAVIITLVLLRPWYALSSKKNRERISRPTRMTIDTTSMKLYLNGELQSNLKLDDLLRAVRLRNFWLLGVTRALNYAIPRRIFSPEQDARFAEVLRSHKLMR